MANPLTIYSDHGEWDGRGLKRRKKMANPLMIHRARWEDLTEILAIYTYARGLMARTGNGGQWGDDYPPEALVREDMARGQLYVVRESGAVCGVFAFCIGKDASYAVIKDGAWHSDSVYGTIHRVAGDGKTHGLFREMVAFCQGKIRHLRIDTHENNQIMRHLIEKNGFQRCGMICVEDGTPRIAYEKE